MNRFCVLCVTALLALAALPFPADLTEAWHHRPQGTVPWRLHPMPESVLLEDADGALTALSSDGGDVLWRLPLGGVLDHAPISNAGRSVFVTGRELTVVELATGAVLDHRELRSAPASAPVLVGDRLVVATHAGLLHVFELGGRELWSFRQPEGFGGFLNIHERPDRSLLILSDGTGRMLAIEIAANKPERASWVLELGAEPVGVPSLGSDGRMFCALQSGLLVQIAVDSGRLVWSRALPGSASAPALRAGSRVVVGGAFGLEAHDVVTGRLAWKNETPAVPRGAIGRDLLAISRDDQSLRLSWDNGQPIAFREGEAPRLVAADRFLGWDGDVLIAWEPTRGSSPDRASGIN